MSRYSGYKAGQNVACRVIKAEGNGYAVVTQKDNLPGYIQTPIKHSPGDEILGVFICVQDGRILLAQLFSQRPKQEPAKQLQFPGHRIDPKSISPYAPGELLTCRVESEENDGYAVMIVKGHVPAFIKTEAKLTPGTEVLGAFIHVRNARVWLALASPEESSPRDKMRKFIGSSEDLSLNPDSNDTEGEDRPDPPKRKARPHKAKDEVPHTPPKTHQHLSVVPQDKITVITGGGGGGSIFRYRRSTDVFVPPVDLKSIRATKNFRIAADGLSALIEELESLKHSGCVKITCDNKNARAAALFYDGRVVGCTYSCKDSIDALAGEEAIAAMLSSMKDPDCQCSKYTLPANVILPMSALFLGQPVERKEHIQAADYYNMVTNYLAEKDCTACVTLVHPAQKLMHLVLFYRGQAAGIFAIDTQKFTHSAEATGELFEKYEDTIVDTCILKLDDENGNARADLGYSLSDIYSRL